jgi:hypothetical protein
MVYMPYMVQIKCFKNKMFQNGNGNTYFNRDR